MFRCRSSLRASLLAVGLFLTLQAPGAAALPEDDSNYFHLDLSYTYDRSKESPGPSFFRSLFELRDLFLLDSRDIELSVLFYSPFELQVAIAKWGFADYHLALGLDAGYLLNTNVSADTREGNSFYVDELAGNRFGAGAFVRYAFTPGVVLKLRYELAHHRYRTSDETPSGFVLPANNLAHTVEGAFKGSVRLSEGVTGVGLLNWGHVFHDEARDYGVGAANSQFRRGEHLTLRAFVEAELDDLTLLGGVTGVYGTRGAIRVGQPLVTVDRFDTLLYGFSERQLPLRWGALHRAMIRTPALFSFLRAQLAYAVLLGREEQASDAHAWGGWSAGLEVPVPIPHVGDYRLLVRYDQAQARLADLDPLHPSSYRITASLGTSFIW